VRILTRRDEDTNFKSDLFVWEGNYRPRCWPTNSFP